MTCPETNPPPKLCCSTCWNRRPADRSRPSGSSGSSIHRRFRCWVSGGLATALGLDQVALGSNTGETTVTLGKSIARNFYVAYERSLSSALGSFSIFYELSRRFTLRGRTGEQSALDLIFTLRYD